MENIKKALEALEVAVKNCNTVKSVRITFTLQKPKPDKAENEN